MWTKRIRLWGRENILQLPHAFIRAHGWKPGDYLLLTATTKNILTVTRVPAGIVPDRVLELAKAPRINDHD